MREYLAERVRRAVDAEPIVDIHTHLYAPAFGATPRESGEPEPLLLWGIDELLGYHYFVDELFRVLVPGSLSPRRFWALPIAQRADLVWEHLFVRRPPVSEACVGVIAVLTALGLDPGEPTLAGYRSWFAARDLERHLDEVMRLAGVRRIVMTNEPFSGVEAPRWLGMKGPAAGLATDPRFKPVVRVDPIVERWPSACRELAAWGYRVREDLSGETTAEVRRFLDKWIERCRPDYLACSLSADFRYGPEDHEGTRTRLFDECLVPVARDHKLMLALMIGARRAVRPDMALAGDGVGKADISQLNALARSHRDIGFLVTMLSRENQHELCVCARKFGNLVPFGCWWYLNTTSQIREITRMRLELLGTSFIPQHSDARVLEQLIYKWQQSRAIVADCLTERYSAAEHAGATITDSALAADVRRLFSQNYEDRTAKL